MAHNASTVTKMMSFTTLYQHRLMLRNRNRRQDESADGKCVAVGDGLEAGSDMDVDVE